MNTNEKYSELEQDIAHLEEYLEPMIRLRQGMWVFDVDFNRILWSNPSGLIVWEASSLEVLQQRKMGEDMSVSVATRLSQYQTDFTSNDCAQFKEIWTVYPNQEPTTLEVIFSSIKLASGRVALFCESSQNNTFDAEAIRSAEALLHTSVQISLFSVTGEPLYQNPAARSNSGSTEEHFNKHFLDSQIIKTLKDGSKDEFKTITNVNTSKGVRWHDVTALRCLDAVSGNHAWLITEVDVSQLKATEEHAQFLAVHDSLTQLPNRNYISIAYQKRIDDLLYSGQQGFVIFIDLDKFKDVNDSLGHEAGDQLLIEVANRLVLINPDEDSVARLGGDEFLLLVGPIDSELQIDNYISEILEKVSRPVTIHGREVQVTPSIGLAQFPNDGRSIQDLMRHADLAMYHAKDAGRNNSAFFSTKMSEAVESRINLDSELLKALENDEFVTYFQPRVDVATNQIVGAEALVRWLHPTHGLVPPDLFIPACEDSGLIKDLGRIVFAHSVVAQKEWAQMGLELQISVNLSPIQFSDPSLAQDLLSIVEDLDGDPTHIELEITESVLLGDDQETIDKLHTLVASGFRIAIDDFGTGYSNLAYLHRYPIKCIKIDRSFVQALDTAQPIVELIISMARLFEMNVVAEGVETIEQLDILRRYRCEEYQGFLFEKAIDYDSFTHLLTQKQLKIA